MFNRDYRNYTYTQEEVIDSLADYYLLSPLREMNKIFNGVQDEKLNIAGLWQLEELEGVNSIPKGSIDNLLIRMFKRNCYLRSKVEEGALYKK